MRKKQSAGVQGVLLFAKAASEGNEIQGSVERITYRSEDSGYTVLVVAVRGYHEQINVVGKFISIEVGQSWVFKGEWKTHPRYGEQFLANEAIEVLPTTEEAIQSYLAGIIEGVGPKTASCIVSTFGINTLYVLDHEPSRLTEVDGIGIAKSRQIKTAWDKHQGIKEIMLLLQGFQIRASLAYKIYKEYKGETLGIVRENPYRLSQDIYGIGFSTADAIALKFGHNANSSLRKESAILHILGKAAERGHCYLPTRQLIEQVVAQLTLPDYQPSAQDLEKTLEEMVNTKTLIMDVDRESERRCYKPSIYYTEQSIAYQLERLLSRPVEIDLVWVRRWLDNFLHVNKIKLNDKQRLAIETAASNRVCILSGSPGTGKSFCCSIIYQLWRAMGKAVELTAPTGRAASRMSEIIYEISKLEGVVGQTIHRLLEFCPQTMSFNRNAKNPLEAQIFLADEMGLADVFLTQSLISAIHLDSQILIQGDPQQLPSISAGNVLRDLIKSNVIPVVHLDEIMRQAKESKIICSAHAIAEGKVPDVEPISTVPKTDFLWKETSSIEEGVISLTKVVSRFLPNRGFDPAESLQVLVPTTRGDIGTERLNKILQEIINPPNSQKPEIERGETKFRLGDRVMQQVNNYQLRAWNGELGNIVAIEPDSREVVVKYRNREVFYDYADLNELSHGFASTVHRAQGSEAPVVVFLCFPHMMMDRALVLTALTRARKLSIAIGMQKVFKHAISVETAHARYTSLSERLIQCVKAC